MNISIASYTFNKLKAAGVMDAFGYLETCKYRYRLDAADFWNGILGPDDLIFDPSFQDKVKHALAEREMKLVNYHVDGCHLWEDDPQTREKHHQVALKHLDVAAKLGAKTMRIDAGAKGDVWTDEQFDFIVKLFKEYAKFAADHGFRVGPETHWGPELVIDNMERLARAVDHPAFGVLVHIGRWRGGTPEEGDRRLAPWAMHTHVDGNTAQTRLESALNIFLSAGYKGYWSIEHVAPPQEYAEVEWQIALVRKALAKLI